jgi:NAD(P)-dependent dehydrogenase (short-subunit alcohol dehydrogenase family)
VQERELGLKGKVVVVAGGGGGGIGTAVCRRLIEAGASVAALDVDPAKLAIAEEAMKKASAESSGGAGGRGVEYAAIIADVCDGPTVEAAVDEAARRLGPLHGLVQVAGGLQLHQWAPLIDTDGETFDAVVRLNLRAPLLTSRAVARHLARQGSGGSIVLIASTVGLQGMPFGVTYAAAKAGVMSLARTAAIEWGPLGIRVNAVAPGTIKTAKNAASTPAVDPPADKAAIPLGRRGVPDDIAGPVLFLLSDLAAYVSGQVIASDGAASVKPAYLDEHGLPLFVHEDDLRRRLLGG